MIAPRVAFGMGRLAPSQQGGVLFLSGMGGFIVYRAGYLVATFARRTMQSAFARRAARWTW